MTSWLLLVATNRYAINETLKLFKVAIPFITQGKMLFEDLCYFGAKGLILLLRVGAGIRGIWLVRLDVLAFIFELLKGYF